MSLATQTASSPRRTRDSGIYTCEWERFAALFPFLPIDQRDKLWDYGSTIPLPDIPDLPPAAVVKRHWHGVYFAWAFAAEYPHVHSGQAIIDGVNQTLSPSGVALPETVENVNVCFGASGPGTAWVIEEASEVSWWMKVVAPLVRASSQPGKLVFDARGWSDGETYGAVRMAKRLPWFDAEGKWMGSKVEVVVGSPRQRDVAQEAKVKETVLGDVTVVELWPAEQWEVSGLMTVWPRS